MRLTFVDGCAMVLEMRVHFLELSFAAFARRRGHLFAVKACQQRLAEAAVLLHPCLDVRPWFH